MTKTEIMALKHLETSWLQLKNDCAAYGAGGNHDDPEHIKIEKAEFISRSNVFAAAAADLHIVIMEAEEPK